MVVLSRILYGDLHVKSFDVLPDNPSTNWVSNMLSNIFRLPLNHFFSENLVEGSLRAVKHDTSLMAPELSILYPYEGNVHEFTAGDYGAAVLDIIVPPYSDDDLRDCTFYKHEVIEGNTSNNASLCSLVPIAEPRGFFLHFWNIWTVWPQ